MSDEAQQARRGINLEAVHCPQCGQRMPAVRVPDSVHQLLWGGWRCPHCGCRMDKSGRAIEPEGQGAEKP